MQEVISIGNFINTLKSMKDYIQLKSASEEEVRKAEESLGLNFADEYKEYLYKAGAASANGFEFTGIVESKRLNVVEVTLLARDEYNLPKNLYVVGRVGIDGIIWCQSANGEIFQIGMDKQVEKLASSLYELISNYYEG